MSQHRLYERPRRLPGTAPAVIGIMACVALLGSWEVVWRVEGRNAAPESLLLEFITGFIILFGTLFVAGTITGVIPRGKPHGRRG
jgi:hypothetical protein